MTDQPVFLATLGQRPQAITMALDVLLPRYNYSHVGVLHTDLHDSGVTAAHAALLAVMHTEFTAVRTESYELRHENGDSLLDIEDIRSAEAYFRAIVEILRNFRAQNIPIHLLVAGGRKAMSIYATLAASWLFGEHDRVWTILAAPDLLASKVYRIPAGRFADVHVVYLPLQPSRLLPGVIAEKNVDELLAWRTNPRQQFMDELTKEESALIEMLRSHPYASTEELGHHLNKAAKTIENQLSSVYKRLGHYFDLDVSAARKRQVLLDVIAGRV